MIETELQHIREIQSVIKEKVIKKWQQHWDNDTKGRHLYAIQKKEVNG